MFNGFLLYLCFNTQDVVANTCQPFFSQMLELFLQEITSPNTIKWANQAIQGFPWLPYTIVSQLQMILAQIVSFSLNGKNKSNNQEDIPLH